MCTQSTRHSSHHSLEQFPESKSVFYYHLSIQRCWSTNPVGIGMAIVNAGVIQQELGLEWLGFLWMPGLLPAGIDLTLTWLIQPSSF